MTLTQDEVHQILCTVIKNEQKIIIIMLLLKCNGLFFKMLKIITYILEKNKII